MKPSLVLACGNTLRGDDGVAWHVGSALKDELARAGAEVILTRQLLPEHAEPLSKVDLAIFIDCSTAANPGMVSIFSVNTAHSPPRIFTHQLDPASLLKLTQDIFGQIPSRTVSITVGGESFELEEWLSESVTAAIPIAIKAVRHAYLNAEQE
jgi:hydrogenase maturation protease